MTEPKVPRLRGGPLPDDAMLAVRGVNMTPGMIERDANRFFRRFPDWNRYGISAFLATSDDEIDAICESRLERFPLVSIFTVGTLKQVGLEVVPTFKGPHVTIAHQSLSRLLDELSICEHRTRENPYYLNEEGEK